MSDTVILAGLSLLGTMFNAYMVYLGVSLNKKTETIHKLVNSNMTTQLEISSIALRRVSDLTQEYGLAGKEHDLAAAEMAEAALKSKAKEE